MFIYKYIYICVCVSVCVYVCACVYMRVCACVWCVFVTFMYYKMSVGSLLKTTNWKIHMQNMSGIHEHYQECSSQ